MPEVHQHCAAKQLQPTTDSDGNRISIPNMLLSLLVGVVRLLAKHPISAIMALHVADHAYCAERVAVCNVTPLRFGVAV